MLVLLPMQSTKPLSASPLGYGLAAFAGVLAFPLGIVVSPLALYLVNKAIAADVKPNGLRWLVWALLGVPAVIVLNLGTAFVIGLASAIPQPSLEAKKQSVRQGMAKLAVTLAAKECSVNLVTGSPEKFQLPEDVAGKCTSEGGEFVSTFADLPRQVSASVDKEGRVMVAEPQD